MPKGFANLTPEKRKEIASMGGKAARGKGHRFTPSEARAAGIKGGKKVAQDLTHMSKIGRKGGRKISEGEEGAKHMAEIGRKGGKAKSDIYKELVEVEQFEQNLAEEIN